MKKLIGAEIIVTSIGGPADINDYIKVKTKGNKIYLIGVRESNVKGAVLFAKEVTR